MRYQPCDNTNVHGQCLEHECPSDTNRNSLLIHSLPIDSHFDSPYVRTGIYRCENTEDWLCFEKALRPRGRGEIEGQALKMP